MKCEYGCNQEAKHQLKNGKWCCSKSQNSCMTIRLKNSGGLSNAHKEGRLSTKHFDGKRGWRKDKNSFSDIRIKSKFKEEFFVENSSVSRGYLRKIIISESIIEYKCSECGIAKWNGKQLSLELEHKNGIRNDNRLKNLTFLCPNCHSQTSTWRRAKNPKNKISDTVFMDDLSSSKNIKESLKKLDLNASGGNYERSKKLLNIN